jgi:hypothetical protein
MDAGAQRASRFGRSVIGHQVLLNIFRPASCGVSIVGTVRSVCDGLAVRLTERNVLSQFQDSEVKFRKSLRHRFNRSFIAFSVPSTGRRNDGVLGLEDDSVGDGWGSCGEIWSWRRDLFRNSSA